MRPICITLMIFTLVSANLYSQTLGSGEAGLSDQNPVKMDKPIRFSQYKNGSFLFVDFNNYAIRQVDINGKITTLFGGSDKKGFKDGNVKDAMFDGIHGVTYDKKNDVIYIASASSNVIRKVTINKDNFFVKTIAGTPQEKGFVDGAANLAKFNSLHEVLYKENGDIFMLDIGNAKIRKLKNGIVSSVVGKDSLTSIKVDWKYPIDMAFDGDDIVVCDAGNSNIYRFTPGKGIKKLELSQPLNMPHGITSDGKGNLYVADMGANAIYKIENDTLVTKIKATKENGFDKLNKPADVIIINGVLWVADLYNHQLKQQKL
ncbi:MAG: hypothetical protein J7K34_10485 [Flavobacteriaceae bacterium]|nr:hypothetical protein [Flavobacteriaceae bacterium]